MLRTDAGPLVVLDRCVLSYRRIEEFVPENAQYVLTDTFFFEASAATPDEEGPKFNAWAKRFVDRLFVAQYPARRLFSPAAPSAKHWPDLSPVSWLANFRHSFRQSNIAAIDRIACSRTWATIPPIHAGHFCPTAPRRPRRPPTDYDTSGTWIRYWVRCTRAWTTGTSEGHWSAREPISSVS